MLRCGGDSWELEGTPPHLFFCAVFFALSSLLSEVAQSGQPAPHATGCFAIVAMLPNHPHAMV